MNIGGIEIAGGRGGNDELGRLCKDLVEMTLKAGDIKGAKAIVQKVYKQELGSRKSGKPPSFKPDKPPVQDRLHATGGSKS
jgi:hypothetical protein